MDLRLLGHVQRVSEGGRLMPVTDVCYAIGKTHDVCQDYGVASDPDWDSGPAYVVASDGCSSSPDTDMGARFLARAATLFSGFDPLAIILKADGYRKAMDLPPQCLDATLLSSQVRPEDGGAVVFVSGDGVVVGRKRDGSGYDHWVLTYNHNAPAYLSYLLDPGRLKSYLDGGCGKLKIEGSEHPQPEEPVLGLNFVRGFDSAEYDLVLVMTDGVTSFQRREGTCFVPVPLSDVLAQILDFKTLTPGFIRRRMGKFLTKFCPQNGWHHTDDITVAGIVLDPPGGSKSEPQA